MNENIKILWNLIEEGFEEMCPLEAQAIKNLITNYQEQEVFIGKLLKENEELKKEKAVLQIGGRGNGKTIELAIQLRKEILELPECKLYGIKKCKNKIILLTKCEVIPFAKIKEQIEKLEKEKQKYEEENTMDEDYFFDINGYDGAIGALQALLEGK